MCRLAAVKNILLQISVLQARPTEGSQNPKFEASFEFRFS